MKTLLIKLCVLSVKNATQVMELISSLLGLFLFSVAVGAGLTFGSLVAFLYVIYGG